MGTPQKVYVVHDGSGLDSFEVFESLDVAVQQASAYQKEYGYTHYIAELEVLNERFMESSDYLDDGTDEDQ